MRLLPSLLDWVFLIIIEIFAVVLFIRNFETGRKSIVNRLLSYLFINDLILIPVSLAHNVPSYFMEEPLSVQYPWIHYLVMYLYLTHFYLGLLMIPVYFVLTTLAVARPLYFNAIKYRKGLHLKIVIPMYIACIAFTVPMFFPDYCDFKYQIEKKNWNYDYTKPYTKWYARTNRSLQFLYVVVTFSAFAYTLVKTVALRKKIGDTVRCAANEQPYEIRMVVSFVVLMTCFLIGTFVWNLVTGVDLASQIIVTIGDNVGRVKWICYCLTLRFFHSQSTPAPSNQPNNMISVM